MIFYKKEYTELREIYETQKQLIEAYERVKSEQDAYIKTLESVISTHEKALYEYEELSKLQRERIRQLEALLEKTNKEESCDESTLTEQ